MPGIQRALVPPSTQKTHVSRRVTVELEGVSRLSQLGVGAVQLGRRGRHALFNRKAMGILRAGGRVSTNVSFSCTMRRMRLWKKEEAQAQRELSVCEGKKARPGGRRRRRLRRLQFGVDDRTGRERKRTQYLGGILVSGRLGDCFGQGRCGQADSAAGWPV